MKLDINKKILSFNEIPSQAEAAEKSVILLRHSMRQSLCHGADPGLTPEGTDYALQCGSFLTGLSEAGFGASPRLRTIETAQALQSGGGFPETEIAICPEIRDTSLFSKPENLEIFIKDGTLTSRLQEYFTTGKADGMIDLAVYSENLLKFLTSSKFQSKNTILTSHDIVCASLLLPLDIYPFKLDDWCGYIQGAALFFAQGKWQVFYTVPDAANRQKYALFI